MGCHTPNCAYNCISLCESGWRRKGNVGSPLVNKLSLTTVLFVGIADRHVTGLKRSPQFFEFYYEILTFRVFRICQIYMNNSVFCYDVSFTNTLIKFEIYVCQTDGTPLPSTSAVIRVAPGHKGLVFWFYIFFFKAI